MVKTSEKIFSELLRELRRRQGSMVAVEYTVISHPYGTPQQLRGEVLERFGRIASIKGPFARLSDSDASSIELTVRHYEMWVDLSDKDSARIGTDSSERNVRMVPREVVGIDNGWLIVRGQIKGLSWRTTDFELILGPDGEIILRESKPRR